MAIRFIRNNFQPLESLRAISREGESPEQRTRVCNTRNHYNNIEEEKGQGWLSSMWKLNLDRRHVPSACLHKLLIGIKYPDQLHEHHAREVTLPHRCNGCSAAIEVQVGPFVCMERARKQNHNVSRVSQLQFDFYKRDIRPVTARKTRRMFAANNSWNEFAKYILYIYIYNNNN